MLREIERLRSRVEELEEQLKNHHDLLNPWKITAHAPRFPEHLDALREHGGNRGSWEYIYTKTSKSKQTTCYGPASSVYFMGRMSSYIQLALVPINTETTTQSEAAFGSLFRSTTPSSSVTKIKTLRRTSSTTFGQRPLSRWQEEYFLDLYWQSYHCMYPIIDRDEFKAHHESLWRMPWESRKSSALVDIVLAVCMQYATALLPPDLTNSVVNAEEKGKDAATAGRSFYRRCHVLLSDDLENPSIMHLQCHILSAIYLFNAGSPNAAQGMIALGCRTGMILGLHREPLDDLDDSQQDFQRRLWWTVYALDIKSAVELGRAIAIQFSQVACNLPSEMLQPRSSSTQVRDPSLLCFGSNLQFIKLIMSWRSIHVTFWRKCAEYLGTSQQRSLYEEPQSLEACAGFLSSRIQYLQSWVDELPDELKANRRHGGAIFSTDGTPLDLSPKVPFLQQRQQVFLELHYHNAAMTLYRPFINFPNPLTATSPESRLKTPMSESNAIACVDHAMAITNTVHQVLTESDVLSGWLETFTWHGNAFISLIGYVLAYPEGPRITDARTSIRKAIATFDLLSSSLAMAASSAKVARDLATKTEVLIERSLNGTLVNSLMSSSTSIQTGTPLSEPESGQYFQNISSPNALTAGPGELVNFTLFSPDTQPVPFTFDFPGIPMDWMSTTDGNQSSQLWTMGQDLNVDSFLLT